MRRIPQIRLRTVFLLFFCAAIGLTCASSPPVEVDPQFAGMIEGPQLNWHYGLLAAASVAIVIGVSHEAVHLARWQPNANSTDFNFARAYGMTWRCAMAFLIVACLIARLLISRRVVALAGGEDFYWGELIPDLVWMVGLTIVLSNSLHRYLRLPERPAPRWRTATIWIAGTCLALLILPDIATIPFLVHLATEFIEWAQPGKFQRVGVYPNHRAEGFRLFWMSIAAIGSLMLAAAVLVSQSKYSDVARRWAAALFVMLLGVPIAFCIWYYRFEFHRISPEFAGTGLASNWLDHFGGIIISTCVVSIGAYQLARGTHTSTVLELSSVGQEPLALHESFPVLILLAIAAIVYLWQMTVGIGPFTGFADIFVYSIRDPVLLLDVAFCILCLQLVWMRWRRRNELIAWRLSSLDRKAYVCNWIACAALVVVGVPTIAAYCFVFWLGPWYLYGP